MTQEELLDLMTILYISIQTTLNDPAEMEDARKEIRTSMSRLKECGLQHPDNLQFPLLLAYRISCSMQRPNYGGMRAGFSRRHRYAALFLARPKHRY